MYTYRPFTCVSRFSALKAVLIASALATSLVFSAHAEGAEDWDKDGLSDKIERRIGSQVYLSDTDGDGISDNLEVGDITSPRDSDQDGRPDILDIDDDGDGIPTVIEGAADSDKDGKPDYLDKDADADGLADRFEVRLTGKDTDGDGVDDRFDVDATQGADENGDGIDDSIALIDSNKDGTPDIIDKKTTKPHHNKSSVETTQASDKSGSMGEKESRPVVVSALKLPVPTRSKVEHSYVEKVEKQAPSEAVYGGTGYFYCANSGKIVTGVRDFIMTPPGKVSLQRDATYGDYKWVAEEPGIYALQFQIPAGMSIVRGLAKGRRIVKDGDPSPLILGGGEDPARKGYLSKPPGDASWYTSFEIKENAPFVENNNIPLSGGSCNQK